MKELSALVVDDDEFIRTVISRQLAGLGVKRVVTASDGYYALYALAEHGPFDFMICDLMMPGVDGIELLRRLSETQPDLAVILISSIDRKVLEAAEDVARARRILLLGSLQKPIQTAELKKLLDSLAAIRTSTAAPASTVTLTATELADAIRHDQISIHLQPQVDTRSGQIRGVEALARWISADKGFVGPQRFIPLAEQHGLIGELTTQVCSKAIAAFATLPKRDPELRLSLNVPIRALQQLDLPEQLTALCKYHGVDPRNLVLEVTESEALSEAVESLDVLIRLRMRGIELSIDDFGTGYSSLLQLKRIPFTELKVDQSFVIHAGHDQDSRRIVESSLKLAHDLGLRSVAEGVEATENWNLVRELGADLAQGYFTGRAMPATEFAQWLEQRQPPPTAVTGGS